MGKEKKQHASKNITYSDLVQALHEKFMSTVQTQVEQFNAHSTTMLSNYHLLVQAYNDDTQEFTQNLRDIVKFYNGMKEQFTALMAIDLDDKMKTIESGLSSIQSRLSDKMAAKPDDVELAKAMKSLETVRDSIAISKSTVAEFPGQKQLAQTLKTKADEVILPYLTKALQFGQKAKLVKAKIDDGTITEENFKSAYGSTSLALHKQPAAQPQPAAGDTKAKPHSKSKAKA